MNTERRELRWICLVTSIFDEEGNGYMHKFNMPQIDSAFDDNADHTAGKEDGNQLTGALQIELDRMMTALTDKGDVKPEVYAALRAWIQTARIVNLSDWLGRAEWSFYWPGFAEWLRGGQNPGYVGNKPVLHEMGWKKVNLETLRKRTFAVARDKQVYEEIYGYANPPESPTLPDGSDDPDVFSPDTVKYWMFTHEWILEMCLFNDPEKNWLAVLAEPWFAERVAVEAD